MWTGPDPSARCSKTDLLVPALPKDLKSRGLLKGTRLIWHIERRGGAFTPLLVGWMAASGDGGGAGFGLNYQWEPFFFEVLGTGSAEITLLVSMHFGAPLAPVFLISMVAFFVDLGVPGVCGTCIEGVDATPVGCQAV